ncbi:MAG: HD domain-containing protein [Firmicutes bacterium]|nr:HD domain-containing protein [Bacillota bacterium]
MDLRLAITRALLEILKRHDPELYAHSLRVTEYSLQMAAHLEMSQNSVTMLYYSALLHDAGKLFIDPQILNKPAPLTSRETEIVRNHVQLPVINQFRQFKKIARAIKHHHEWYNGRGYPDGLHGKEIPLESRILAVADAMDAMMSKRPYRDAIGLSEAVAEIKKCSGTQFDPELASAFCSIIEVPRDGRELLAQVPQAANLCIEQSER